MASSRVASARYVAAGLLLVTLFSTISPLAHSATTSSVQRNLLVFTVNPNKNVGIAWNATTSSSAFQNASKSFPPGYAIQLSSSFSQQSNAVVGTTTVQYQLPPKLNQNLSLIVASMSFTGSQSGLTGQGSLNVTTTSAFPVQNTKLSYSTSPTRVQANATAQVYFNSQYAGTPLNLFSSWAAFQVNWTATFGNSTWRSNIVSLIQNNVTNHALTVMAFNGTATYNSATNSANVAIGFVGVPSSGATSFINAISYALPLPGTLPSQLTTIIQSIINLETSETITMTYTGTSGLLTYKATTNYVSNLDSQVNTIKGQFFQLLFNTVPTLANEPSVDFLNATTVTVSKISMTSNLDLNAGTASTSLNGLIIGPPTVGTNTNFTIPGLFQTLGSAGSTTGINITLAGGSDASNQVKVVVPSGTPSPDSSTSNSYTWYNVKNATVLSSVRFLVQPLPFSIVAFLTSPTGIIIEAIVAAAVVASIALLVRRRRSTLPTSPGSSGPTTPPGFGPSPAPPTQAN